MTLHFTKGKGKPDRLLCRRSDGSCTWSALNFTAHDFGHYSIETTLGWRSAFFGLLAQGWDIADFGRAEPATGKKPAVPAEAMQAEALAGLLDMERRSANVPCQSAFMEMLVSVCVGLGIPAPVLTPDQLDIIRSRHTDLLRQWAQVRPGGALELPF